MKGSLNQYLIRITVFLVLILVVIIFLYPTIQTAFLSNIYINILITIDTIKFCLCDAE